MTHVRNDKMKHPSNRRAAAQALRDMQAEPVIVEFDLNRKIRESEVEEVFEEIEALEEMLKSETEGDYDYDYACVLCNSYHCTGECFDF